MRAQRRDDEGKTSEMMRGRIQSHRDRLDELSAAIDDRLPEPLKLGLGTLYVYSTRQSALVDRLATHRWWRRWTDLSIVVLLVLQAVGLAVIALAAVQALGQTGTTALNDPANTIAIPGLNAFMPLASTPYVVGGLVVATVVHEAGHAIACRAEDLPVEEWGVALLLGVVPLAGYVLPSEELDDAPVRSRMRVYAVGVFHNLLVAMAAYAVLLSPLTGTPAEAFVAYFGWAAAGGSAPTAATVASLGALTNLAFWLALLNVNFGLLNALPVSILDGGRVVSLSLESTSDRFGLGLSAGTRSLLVHTSSVVVVVLVGVAIVGPYLWT